MSLLGGGSTYEIVTISALLCILKHINSKLSPDVKDSRLAEHIKETVLQDLNNDYSSPEFLQLLYICFFLDPQFKCEYKEECLCFSETHLNDNTALKRKTL